MVKIWYFMRQLKIFMCHVASISAKYSSLCEFVVSITGHESYKSISSLKRPLDIIANVTIDVVDYSVKTYYTIKIIVIILVFIYLLLK
jgi:hypothetical protein